MTFHVFVGLGEDAASGRFGFDPGGEGEWFHVAEVGDGLVPSDGRFGRVPGRKYGRCGREVPGMPCGL